MPYQPIENYGVIGNMRTAALVGMNGSIDWYCFPAFDSPSVFAAILDDKKGGSFSIAPATEHTAKKQFYWPDTNVLVTRFFSTDGVGQITDFMPVGVRKGDPGYEWLIRRVTVSRGSMKFRAVCRPAFDYARAPHEIERKAGCVRFRNKTLTLELSSEAPIHLDDGSVTSEFALNEGEAVSFVLRPADGVGGGSGCVSDAEAQGLFESTVEYWRRWLSACTYFGRWREMVQRSALSLKLLTYEPSGAMVAAVTCGLPEDLGGGRNWDYRYTWIRDAAFTMYAFMRIGFVEEAGHFMNWLSNRCRELGPDGSLQIMYGIDGRSELTEEILDHFEGYRGSAPVRVGNGAYDQLQLDIYGELMDSVYLFNKYGRPIAHDGWMELSAVVDWLCTSWDQPDEGIWETRGGRQNFTYSRLMCWVALERGIQIARQRGLPADLDTWRATRDAIYHQIMSKGWSEKRQAFVQHFDTDVLDASLLLMPLVKFVAPTDPRWLSTLDAITNELVSDSLVYRYNVEASPDGLAGDEGTFSICSFWYVEALARAGRLEEARLAFEKMLTYANHLGLYSEEIGPTGEQLGNFPQAFTHLALISAAVNLDYQLG